MFIGVLLAAVLAVWIPKQCEPGVCFRFGRALGAREPDWRCIVSTV